MQLPECEFWRSRLHQLSSIVGLPKIFPSGRPTRSSMNDKPCREKRPRRWRSGVSRAIRAAWSVPGWYASSLCSERNARVYLGCFATLPLLPRAPLCALLRFILLHAPSATAAISLISLYRHLLHELRRPRASSYSHSTCRHFTLSAHGAQMEFESTPHDDHVPPYLTL